MNLRPALVMMRLCVAVLGIVGLVACQGQNLSLSLNGSGSITGTVLPWSGTGAFSASSTCPGAIAELYSLDATGKRGLLPLATTTVNADGTYHFPSIGSIHRDSVDDAYLVLATGCGDFFARAVTGSANQDLSGASTLLSFGSTSSARQSFRDAIVNTQGAAFNAAVATVKGFAGTTVSALAANWEANAPAVTSVQSSLGVTASQLHTAAPLYRFTATPPTVFSESTLSSISLSLLHFDSTYTPAVTWWKDGSNRGSGTTWNFTPRNNDQKLNASLAFDLGSDDGAGDVSTAQSFEHQSWTVNIANIHPAVVPNVTLASASVTASPDIYLQVDTGAALANCDTFSNLVVLETGLPPTDADFVATGFACTTAPAQSVHYVLSDTSDGPKTLAVWARDAAGNISIVPQNVSFTFSSAAPTLAFATPAAGTNRPGGVTVTGSCQNPYDVTVGGSDVLAPVTVPCAAGAFSATVSFTASQGSKDVTLTQTDLGGIATTATRTFVNDTIAPAPVISAPAANTVAQTGLTLTGSCETGLTVNISGAGVAAPSTTSCTGAAFTANITFSTGDGTKNVVVSQTDAAGNTGTDNRDFVRDATPPNLTIATPAAGQAGKSGLTLTGSCESGLSISFSGSGLLAPFSVTCSGSSYSQAVNFSASDGSKTITLSQTDAVGNTTTVSRNFVRDNVAPTITQTAVTSPVWTTTNTATFGGACESPFTIAVSGADTATISCTSNAWTYTTSTQTSDGTRDYTFTQTDGAGNSASVTAQWVRKTSPPALSFTSASSQTTASNAVTFAGNCLAGVTVQVSLTETASVPCAGGTWSYTVASQTSDATYNYDFTQTDPAGNTATIHGTWVRNTSGPVLTITSPSPVVNNQGSATFSGACDSAYSIVVSGAGSGTLTCTGSAWSYTPTAVTDATRTYTLTQTNGLGVSTSINLSWQRDTVAPSVTALSLNGGAGTTSNPYVTVALSAQDADSKVTKVCLKTTDTTQPAANDSCWTAVNSPSIGLSPASTINITSSQHFTYPVEITPGAYDVFAWAQDEAGNVSNLSNAGTGTTSVDLASITYYLPAVVSVESVLASKSTTINGADSERQIPAGQTVTIKWRARANPVASGGIALFYTTDDQNWQAISGAETLNDGVNGGCTLNGPGSADDLSTGCWTWSNGSPTSSYYRIRVQALSTTGGLSFGNSLPVNSATVRVIAGNIEDGIGSSANAALFFNDTHSASVADPQSLIMHPSGKIFFRDVNRGLIYVDPADGKLHSLISLGAAGPGEGDGGPVTGAKLYWPSMLTMDPQGRLLVYDFNRIRRIDVNASPATITTIIGGGGDTSDTVATATNVHFDGMGNFRAQDVQTPIEVLANGDIYFFSEAYGIYSYKRIRIYHAATGQVTSLRPTGSWTDGATTVPDLTQCGINSFDVQSDPTTGTVTKLLIKVAANPGRNCASPDGWYFGASEINPTTGAAMGSMIPAYPNEGSPSHVEARDGKIYEMSRNDATIRRYNAGTNAWDILIGVSGNPGHCADNTTATSCAIDPLAAWVNQNGVLFFTDRGLIRTIHNGNVVTIAGQSFSYGDGGLATNARFGIVTGLAQRTNGNVVILDATENKFREFTRQGNISLLAGNGASNWADTSTPANAQPLRENAGWDFYPNFGIDSVTDDLYWVRAGRAAKLSSSTGLWVDLGGTGATELGDPATNGSSGNSWAGTMYSAIIGFDGSNVLMGSFQFNGLLEYYHLISQIRLSDGFLTFVTDPGGNTAGTRNSNGAFCADGTSLASCASTPMATRWYADDLPGMPMATWDATGARWIVLDTDRLHLRTLVVGGALGTIASTNLAVKNYVYTRWSGHEIVYYCAATDGHLYKHDITAATEAALDWPVSAMKCTGKSLVLDPSTHTLIFSFLQNGVSGVAEHLVIDP